MQRGKNIEYIKVTVQRRNLQSLHARAVANQTAIQVLALTPSKYIVVSILLWNRWKQRV